MDALFLPRRSKKISLTALIDVVFILLMFFMLTSSFTHWQSLSLPSASASTTTQDGPPALVLVYASNDIRVLTDHLSEPVDSGQAIAALSNGRKIVISAEENASVQQILSVMNILDHAGVESTLGQPFQLEGK